MSDSLESLSIKFAETPGELRAAQKLRYDIFVREMGADGPYIDHATGLESDPFDPFCEHLIAIDDQTQQVVGVYRLLLQQQARAAGQFYSEDEFDLTRLKDTGRNLLELGRSCLHRNFRDGRLLHKLWTAIGQFVIENKVDILFGVASFPTTQRHELEEALAYLHHFHLAPPHLRVKTNQSDFRSNDRRSAERINRKQVVLELPSLIKAYLRLGGVVGEGAYVDSNFKTIDICLVLDINRINPIKRRLFMRDSQ